METANGGPVIRTRSALYYGWILLIAVVFVMLAGSGIRAVFGVFIKPIETEFGWTRQQLSGAAALSLFVLGAVAPRWAGSPTPGARGESCSSPRLSSASAPCSPRSWDSFG